MFGLKIETYRVNPFKVKWFKYFYFRIYKNKKLKLPRNSQNAISSITSSPFAAKIPMDILLHAALLNILCMGMSVKDYVECVLPDFYRCFKSQVYVLWAVAVCKTFKF